MARIRIGHTRFTHKYFIEKSQKTEPPKYNSVGTLLTVKHIIGECPFFIVIRRRNFKNSRNFEEIMDEGNSFDPERLFNFSREIGFLHQI